MRSDREGQADGGETHKWKGSYAPNGILNC
jgi:hypothetical protein